MIFAGSERVATLVPSGGIQYYHPDHLGSSNVITDATGAKVQNLTYYPYGATRTNSSPVTPVVNVPYKYTGKELDASTELYNYEARQYEPALGRFISPDTVVPDPFNPQDFNRYAYVRNSPFSFTDPTGYEPADHNCPNVFPPIVGCESYQGLPPTQNLPPVQVPQVDVTAPPPPPPLPPLDFFPPSPPPPSSPNWGGNFGQGGPGERFPSNILFQPILSIMFPVVGLANSIAGGILGEDPFSQEQVSLSDILIQAATLGRVNLANFGKLSRAAEFGLRPYSKMRPLLKGTGLQSHHIIEGRFKAVSGIKYSQGLTVAVSKEEHLVFTNAWREAIPYGEGTRAALLEDVITQARGIYKDYPAILRSLE